MVASKLALWLAAASAVLAGPLAEPAVSKRALSAGTVYTACTKANTIALTFDDGPYAYTEQALNLLDNAGMKGTFFMNGQNWGSIYDYTSIVQRVYNSGHQVGSHT
jgi:peptidoglycan/xylan/chitin deacetylase (PgdA/CDA1 family)